VKFIDRLRSLLPAVRKQAVLSPVDNRGWYTVFESFPGAWQQNVEVSQDKILSHPIVYACVTLIASDIGKLSLRLMELQQGLWQEAVSPSFSPVLRRPNHFQTRQQFIESWQLSKLNYGNAYILKVRDNRMVVTSQYVLDPNRVKPLVAPDGSVFYALNSDDLSKLPFDIPAIPASEIIHDRMECLFHPLVGISPLFAAGLAATQGIKMLNNSAKFFENMARPSGILTAPGQISDATAQRIKDHWEKNYRSDNIGKVAVLGDALTYSPMSVTAVDSQLVEQDDKVAEKICSAFHVPPYMVGVGPMPTYNNIEALNLQYYAQCLQKHIEAVEACLDVGLALPSNYRTEFDLDDLLRMDTATRIKSTNEAVAGGWLAPNEARRRFGLKPATGGDSPMMQQQQFSLQALSERDQDKPFSKPAAAPPATPAVPTDSAESAAKAAVESIERLATAAIQKQQEPPAQLAPVDDSAREAVASMERLAAAAIQKEAPDHIEAIRALIDGMAEKQAKAVDDLSRRVESLSEKDDDVDAYADLLTRMTARFEAAHVA
jgi:HK97 family phage portal protein